MEETLKRWRPGRARRGGKKDSSARSDLSRRRLRFPRFWLLAAWFTLTSLAFPPASASEVAVALTMRSAGVFQIDGHFPFQGSRKTAWSVLSDYEHIDDFVSTMRKSKVKKRRKDSIIVEQEVLGRFLILFTRKICVLLEVKELPLTQIDFTDTSHRDFRDYKGYWKIEEAERGFTIHYRLRLEPNFSLPQPIARRIFLKNARSLLEEVQSEMDRRQSTPI